MSRRPVLLTGILWLAAAAALALVTLRLFAARDLAPEDFAALAASLALQVVVPLAIVLAALTLVGRGREAPTAIGDGRDLADTATRLEAAAAALAAAATSAGTSAAALLAAIPALQVQADALAATLATTGGETGRQLGEVETMLAGVWARNADAREQVAEASATTAGLLAGIEAASVSAADAIAARTADLSTAVDAALARMGGAAAEAIAQRLEGALAAADRLGHQLAAQDGASKALVGSVERSFAVLDARLGHAATMSQATLDGIAARTAALRGSVDAIGPPLHDAEATATRLAAQAAAVDATLGGSLPEHRATLAGLSAQVAALSGEALALAAPVADGRDAAQRLGAHLAEARTTLAAVEDQSRGSALAASTQLIEVLARVREVAAAASGTMRDTLGGIVAEAEAAFATPVRAELAGLAAASDRAGAAAQAAADRIAARLLGLTGTIATVEARVAAIDADLDARLRDDIAARSGALLDTLRAGAIDLARPLAKEVADADWAAYLRGDRGLFARRAVRLIDRGTARAIAARARADPGFAEQAARYVDAFEALLRRVAPAGDGSTLAVTLVSSDVGKLYVVLAQAFGRR